MGLSEGRERVTMTVDSELLEWLDEAGIKRRRTRSWMLDEAIRQWKQRVESAAERRRKQRAKRKKRLLDVSADAGR